MENKYKKAEQKGEIVIELIRSLGNKLKAFVDINCESVILDQSKWRKIYNEIMNENLLNNEIDTIKNISQSVLDLVLLKKNEVNNRLPLKFSFRSWLFSKKASNAFVVVGMKREKFNVLKLKFVFLLGLN